MNQPGLYESRVNVTKPWQCKCARFLRFVSRQTWQTKRDTTLFRSSYFQEPYPNGLSQRFGLLFLVIPGFDLFGAA